MQTAWLLRCFALGWSLFSLMSFSPPGTEPPTAMEAPIAAQPQSAPLPEDRLVLPGVVIEKIPKGSALEKAGLQVGDVILSWQRLPSPPANLQLVEGEISSYFDWLDLEVEQVPRGVVVLRGRRSGALLELRVEPGLWEAKVRPVLTAALDEVFERGEAQLAGNLEGAVETWRTLGNSFPKRDSRDLQAWILFRIGEAWGEKSEWVKAVEAYRAAIDAAQRLTARAVGWEALGDVRENQNQNEAAEQAYASALEIRRGLGHESLGIAASLGGLGSLVRVRGDLRSAQGHFLKALEISAKLAPQSLPEASALYNLGAVAWIQGEQVKAREYAQRALDIEEALAPQSHRLAANLGLLGALAWTQGDLSLAYEYHLKALRLNEHFESESLSVATSLNNLAVVAESRGELDSAIDFSERALGIRERLAPKSRHVAMSLNNLGVVARNRGEFERAYSYFSRALQIYEQVAPESLHVANSLTNLGAVDHSLGNFDRAYELHFRALQLRRELAPRSLQEAASLNNLGNVAWARGHLDEARRWYSQALQIKEHQAPEGLAVAASLNNMGNVERELKKFGEALKLYRHSLQIYEHLAPQNLMVAQTLNNMGVAADGQHDLESAHSYYLKALSVLEHQFSRLGSSYDSQADFRTEYRAFYLEPLDLLLGQSRFGEAFQLLERFRAQTFLTMLTERDVAFSADVPQELDRERWRIGALYDQTLKKLAGLNPHGQAGEIETTRKELQRLDNEFGDLEARIRRASPRLAALRYPQPLDVSAAQQALDPGSLLLAFSVGKDKAALFALSRAEALEVKILPLGEEALRTRVMQLLGLIREARGGTSLGKQRRAQLQAASRALYAALLGPVAKRIAESKRLLILPDGPLHALPFAALVRDTEEGPQYLAEWKPLHVALSATVFAELKQRRHPTSEGDTVQLAAFGDPVYPQSLKALKNAPADGNDGTSRADPTVRGAAERGLFDFQPLPYTRREVLGVASLFPGGAVRTFLGPDALEERIKSLDPKTRILHLAAHGSIDEHLPSGSFIALTIPEETPNNNTGPQRDNGLLQVWEIFEKVRLHADLVVLSACDTALGEEQGGEGLIGLTRAFQYAGARTVMASLWSVQDQATSELMIRFYKHLRAGRSKDEALRQAQIELIRGPIEVVNEKGEKALLDASSPYYWAGFQVYGDWQ